MRNGVELELSTRESKATYLQVPGKRNRFGLHIYEDFSTMDIHEVLAELKSDRVAGTQARLAELIRRAEVLQDRKV